MIVYNLLMFVVFVISLHITWTYVNYVLPVLILAIRNRFQMCTARSLAFRASRRALLCRVQECRTLLVPEPQNRHLHNSKIDCTGVFNGKLINVTRYHYYCFYTRIIVFIASSRSIILKITIPQTISCITDTLLSSCISEIVFIIYKYIVFYFEIRVWGLVQATIYNKWLNAFIN